ncbi:hypothetical protein [Pseudomonas graminis]|uniref:Uncharacterized protein n=1 Tax=Pseudomonas graminis TaxID=158627 RepID=A0A1C2DH80_9PSED|nr:hypothetical protein [Pseudomonas graminis]OCX14112.1 hypothetical protein BBI10_21450 [Pseudomonas graminis]
MTDDQVLKAIRVINERLEEQKNSYDEVRRCYASFLIKLIGSQMVQALPSDGLETIVRYLQHFADTELIDHDDGHVQEMVHKLWTIEKHYRELCVTTSGLARFAIHCAASEAEWLEMDLGAPTPIWTCFITLKKVAPDIGEEFVAFFHILLLTQDGRRRYVKG